MANLNEQNARLASKRRQSNRRRGILAVLGCAVVVITASVLMMPAISMSKGELTCGFEEHAHGDACYSQVLTCGQQETEGHAHTDACYENVLVCDEEDPDHVHTDACYEKQLTCGQEESKGHTHSDACYEKQLTCDTPEHTHTDACYTHVQANEEKTVAKAEESSEAAEPAKGEQSAKAEESAKSSSANATSKEATDKSSSAAASTSSASASSAAASKAEAKMPAVDFEKNIKRNNEPDIKVIVKAPEGAFPEGTTMEAKLIAANDVQSKVEAAIERETGEEAKVKSITAVDIVFKDKDGKEIEPAKKVEVKITSDEVRDIDNPMLVHVLDKAKDSSKGKSVDAEIVGGVKIVDDDATGAEDNTMKFESEAFSPYVIVELEDGDVDPETGARTINVSNEDAGYSITVNIPAEAGVPSDARLSVEELLQPGRAWTSHVDVLEEQMGAKISYARMFDITILDAADNEIQPAVPVEVKITLDDAADLSDNMTVAHFASEDEVEFVDANLSGDTVSFDAEGFSVYAVVDGSTDDYARMTVRFYSKRSEAPTDPIATMYVKNGDTAEELETIIYDPGVGTLESGEMFVGWILDKPAYTSEDVANAWNIDDVRAWAEALEITEGNAHRLDAMICKMYHITYKDLDGTVIGKQSVPVVSDGYGTVSVDHAVNMPYTPHDDMHNFEGWILDDESRSAVTSEIPEDGIYQNNDPISIKGDISFTVNAPRGQWLVFDENGRGGKYNAPKFVKDDEVTSKPCADVDMTRKGYTFGGWYDTKEHADAHGANPAVTTGAFVFGGKLSEKTTIYASWIPKETAPYTVVFWGQKLNSDGTDVVNDYEVLGSYVNENGRVGQNIPYTFEENGDEDYVTGVGEAPGEKYSNGHYQGFCLTGGSVGQQVTITPEGDAVLNLYYDRIKYNFKFYLYRDGTQNNRYDYANNSGGGRDLNDLVTWHANQTQHPSVTGYTVQSERVGNRTYYYFVMPAYYGENIANKWPKYNQITGANNREAVSFVMMVGTKLKPNPSSGGDGTVKGVITVMNENILGATNNANGNYVVIRFPDSYYNWRYHIWLEAVNGEVPAGKTEYRYNGKLYYEDEVQVVRSSNITDANQNEPKYMGFEYQTRMGQNQQGTWGGGHWAYDQNGRWAGQNNTQNRQWEYHLNYIYNREVYRISYFDGVYVDSNGNVIESHSETLLDSSEEIPHGQIIPDDCKEYTPDAVEGYVFQGWYADEACNVPYSFDTMPIGGIKVYAKWVQKQYRVIMHPNAGNDPNLDWGSSTVSMSFRVDYDKTVGLPQGTREGSGYEFVGWYTDPSFSPRSLFSSDEKLNDSTVTTLYDKTEATELDWWGNPYMNDDGEYVDDEGVVLTPTWNKDSNKNRFWIERKLDLYAKWRKIIEGADGIQVEYTADDGQGHVGDNPPIDDTSYLDQADATAQAAPTAPEGYTFDYWVIQKWDEAQNKYVDTDEAPLFPSDHFTVKEEYAHKELVPGTTDQYTYTVQLRAQYKKIEEDTPTHIWWFPNYSNDPAATRHDASHRDEDIAINESVGIQAAPTRDGYTFLGWARVPVTVSESEAKPTYADTPTGLVLDKDTAASYLYLRYENGKYYLNDPARSEYDGREVTQVAADERQQYHDMYAVWEENKYSVTVIKQVDSDVAGDQNVEFTFTPSDFDEDVPGTDVTTPFKLKGSDTAGKTFNDGAAQDPKVKIVPYGSTFKITEDAAAGFMLDKVTGSYVDDAGTTHQIKDGDSEDISNLVTGGTIEVLGDTTITFVNKRALVDVTVKKELQNTYIGDAAWSFGYSAKIDDKDPTTFSVAKADVNGYTIENVPIGATMAITEDADTGYSYTVSADGVAGGSMAGSTYTFTVPSEDATVTFTNTVDTRTGLKAIKTDDKTPATILSGATFTLTRNEKLDGTGAYTTLIKEVTTTSDGIIIASSDVLPIGAYQLKETAAPEGYIVESDTVEFKVKADGTFELIGAPSNASLSADSKTLTITNKAGKPLPNTGGAGTLPYTLGGIALVVIAACMYGFGSRRNRERGSRG